MLTRDPFRASLMNPFRSWDPFVELQRLNEEVNRLFNGTRRPVYAEYPALNVWSNEEETVVTAELPGFDPDDIEISAVQNILTLRGTRKAEEPKNGDVYHRRERWTGKFVRTLELPFEVDSDKVQARFLHGVLTIELPRLPEHKPKKITIKAS